MKISRLCLLAIALCLANPVYSQNNWIVKLLQQENWHWVDLDKYRLGDSEMHIFEINHAVSSIDLAQLIAGKFQSVFAHIQMIQDSYVLNGIYKDLHVQAQIYSINKLNSRAYISLLKESNHVSNTDYLTNLLPMDKRIIASVDDQKAQKKITLFNISMPLNELYLYLLEQLNSKSVNNIFNKHIHKNNYFWLAVNLANGKNLYVYANHAKANKTVVATVYGIKANS